MISLKVLDLREISKSSRVPGPKSSAVKRIDCAEVFPRQWNILGSFPQGSRLSSSFANACRYTFSDDCFSCTFPRQVEATAC